MNKESIQETEAEGGHPVQSEGREIPLARMTKAYLKMRAYREDLRKKYEAEDGQIERSMERIKDALLQYCKDNDINSVKTDSGTFFRSVRTKYWTSDWDSFHKFVHEKLTENPEDISILGLFEKRLHQGNLKTYLDDNPDAIPKGLNADSYYSISIRSPKS